MQVRPGISFVSSPSYSTPSLFPTPFPFKSPELKILKYIDLFNLPSTYSKVKKQIKPCLANAAKNLIADKDNPLGLE